MDTRDGTIIPGDRIRDYLAADPLAGRYVVPMTLEPTAGQRRRGRVGRNEYCPCGSGRRFKRCCLNLPPDVRKTLATQFGGVAAD